MLFTPSRTYSLMKILFLVRVEVCCEYEWKGGGGGGYAFNFSLLGLNVTVLYDIDVKLSTGGPK